MNNDNNNIGYPDQNIMKRSQQKILKCPFMIMTIENSSGYNIGSKRKVFADCIMTECMAYNKKENNCGRCSK